MASTLIEVVNFDSSMSSFVQLARQNWKKNTEMTHILIQEKNVFVFIFARVIVVIMSALEI